MNTWIGSHCTGCLNQGHCLDQECRDRPSRPRYSPAKEEKQRLYASIVLLQSGDDTEEPEIIFNQRGPEALLNYLIQWDYGPESEHDMTTDEPWGTSDRVYHFIRGGDEYVVNVNQGLPYFGLTRVVNRVRSRGCGQLQKA